MGCARDRLRGGDGVVVQATARPGADHWTAALEHLDAAGRTLAAANVDATPRPELTPAAAADVERAALAAHRALEAIGEGRGGSPGSGGRCPRSSRARNPQNPWVDLSLPSTSASEPLVASFAAFDTPKSRCTSRPSALGGRHAAGKWR